MKQNDDHYRFLFWYTLTVIIITLIVIYRLVWT